MLPATFASNSLQRRVRRVPRPIPTFDASPRAILADADCLARREESEAILVRHLGLALARLREQIDNPAIRKRLGLDVFLPPPFPAWMENALETLRQWPTRSFDWLPLDPALPPFLQRKILGRKNRGGSLKKWAPDLWLLGDPFLDQVIRTGEAPLQGPLANLDRAGRIARDIHADLARHILGQEEAIEALSDLVFRILMRPTRTGPRGIAVFAGPPGVGKTFSARLLSQCLIHRGVLESSRARELVLNMTQYSQPNSDLFGQRYADCEIATHVRQFPESVIVLNEMEKAHGRVINQLLPVLDDGCLTFTGGITMDFRGCIFVFTTNLGAEAWERTDLAGNDSFVVDPLEVLGLSGLKDRAEDGWTQPPFLSKEFISRLQAGATILFSRPRGFHLLAKMQSGCKASLQDHGMGIR